MSFNSTLHCKWFSVEPLKLCIFYSAADCVQAMELLTSTYRSGYIVPNAAPRIFCRVYSKGIQYDIPSKNSNFLVFRDLWADPRVFSSIMTVALSTSAFQDSSRQERRSRSRHPYVLFCIISGRSSFLDSLCKVCA